MVRDFMVSYHLRFNGHTEVKRNVQVNEADDPGPPGVVGFAKRKVPGDI